MVKPYEVAVAAHEVCLTKLIPSGMSPPHDFPSHLPTAEYYANEINKANLEGMTGGAIVRAIIAVTGWDMTSLWPGHPNPEDVLNYLKELNESNR